MKIDVDDSNQVLEAAERYPILTRKDLGWYYLVAEILVDKYGWRVDEEDDDGVIPPDPADRYIVRDDADACWTCPELSLDTDADIWREYPQPETCWCKLSWVDTWTGEAGHKVFTFEPAVPDCTQEAHDWQAPHSVVGGLEENPGVVGHGGGVCMTSACSHCGTYRTLDTWAQNPQTGEQGLESTRYDPPDEKSLAWVASLKEEEEDTPAAFRP